MEPILLDAQHISVTIGHRTILKDCSLEARAGEFIGILGPNGAGKSTFLKALRQLIPRSGGTVSLKGVREEDLSEKDIARTIAFMQQDFHISFGYTCKEIVLSARYPYLKWWQKENQNDKAIADKWMAYTGTSAFAEKPIQSLSGGEKQRVMLAKVLAQETPILFLDEPTAALDLLYQEEIFRLCKALSKQGKTIIMICHDLMMAAEWCSRLILVSDHHFLADGKPEDVLTEQHLKEAFHLDSFVYQDPITDRLSLYSYQRQPARHASVLLLGHEPMAITLMRHLFLAGYDVQWGYLPENTLAREAARAFHIPFLSREDPFHLAALLKKSAALIACKDISHIPLPPFSLPCYTPKKDDLLSLLQKIDNGEL